MTRSTRSIDAMSGFTAARASRHAMNAPSEALISRRAATSTAYANPTPPPNLRGGSRSNEAAPREGSTRGAYGASKAGERPSNRFSKGSPVAYESDVVKNQLVHGVRS